MVLLSFQLMVIVAARPSPSLLICFVLRRSALGSGYTIRFRWQRGASESGEKEDSMKKQKKQRSSPQFKDLSKTRVCKTASV